MFFDGSLQEGIGAAVKQQKRVICFVHDDADESARWESDYLRPLSAPLTDHAVMLKILLGSQEATFLSAICPVQSAPMVVVISNGQVKQALAPPMEVQEFREQILAAMDLSFTISDPTSGNPAPLDRAAKSDEGSATSAAQASPVVDAKEAQLAKLRQEVQQRHKQHVAYRQRVLDNIEADKEERRKHAAERARERARERAHGLGEVDDTDTTSPAVGVQKIQTSSISRLQLRFEDEFSERVEFPATDPLTSVRNWVKAHEKLPKGSDFSFRPMRGIGAASQISREDENKSLAELGFTPSATLIIKTIAKTTIAGGSVSWLWSLVLAIFMPIWSFLTGLFGKRPAAENGPSRTMQHEEVGRSTGVESKSAERGDKTKSRDKPSLYNGNQTSVLPNDPSDEE